MRNASLARIARRDNSGTRSTFTNASVKIAAKKAPDERRALGMRLGGVVAALVLIALGVMAIGRSLFGSGAPTIG